MSNWLDSKIFTLLEGGLDGLSLRQKVLADNIANVDTPKFKRSDIDFDRILLAAIQSKDVGDIELRRSSPKHFSGVGMTGGNFVIQDKSTTFRNDGNNVDIDLEMAKLAENTIQYNALTRSLTSHITMLRQVIQG